jgi:hypothetical protein
LSRIPLPAATIMAEHRIAVEVAAARQRVPGRNVIERTGRRASGQSARGRNAWDSKCGAKKQKEQAKRGPEFLPIPSGCSFRAGV